MRGGLGIFGDKPRNFWACQILMSTYEWFDAPMSSRGEVRNFVPNFPTFDCNGLSDEKMQIIY